MELTHVLQLTRTLGAKSIVTDQAILQFPSHPASPVIVLKPLCLSLHLITTITYWYLVLSVQVL